QGGVMVMINDRVMTMSSTDLLNYLESINAEDVKSIDVVRSAGAKYDASASGAVLKINLRNRSKVEGVFGTVSMNYRRTDTLTTLVMPSVWVNAMYGKLSLSTGFTYARRQYSQFLRQYSCFRQLGDTINSESVLNNGQHSYNYTLRGVYNIDERNSVGVDYDFRRSPSDEDNFSSSVGYGRSYGDLMNYATTKSLSPSDLSKTHDLSVNYRRTLDSLGSDLLLVADYHRSNSWETNISELMQQLDAVKVLDYVKSASLLKNDFYTARIDVTKRFNTKWSLSYGAKYSYSKMSSVFEYYSSEQGTEWVYDDVYSDDYRYREGIAAAYASATGRVGRLNIMAGLRVENTDLRPTSLKQSENHHNNYTDFFPSASLSYLLTAKGDYVAAMSYRRSIRRPGFAMLNPRRQPIDNISVAVGNPYLKPSYSNNVSLNFTLAGRYMLTAAYEGDKDLFAQVAVIDENNPEIVMYKNDNIDKQDILIFNAYLPFNPFKWWNFNISGGSGLMQSTFMGRERSKWFYRGMANMTFLLPKKWIVEMSGWCAGNMIQGNIVVDRPVASMDASVKKTFLDGKLTLMAEVKGIVYTKTSMLI
ncbi:MAG: outer membrane beta-barrel family protein, partial [Rikenellaceae bacterium]|nr:outer membrane beta-barrel family protein [Rikenellaceae bacterium]